MKILIGICGIGNGHINRQTSVIKFLLKNNYDLVVATTKENVLYFKQNFKNLKIIEINIPWIYCNDKGIDFTNTLKKYEDSKIDLFKSFLTFAKEVEKYFQNGADIVITDYEPNVAQYSYAKNIPLICMEQQSKFLYIDELKIKDYSIEEEKKRINYFFPKFDYKIISSFFPIKIKDKRIKIVRPIITQLHEKKDKKEQIIVYFSPYENSENYQKILDVISQIKDKNFIVYTKNKYKITTNNVMIKNYSNEFKKDLENSICLISTAGHQLISEAVSINLPIYLLPLSTYEQNYNALMVEKYHLGKTAINMDLLELNEFIKSIPYLKNKIELFRKKYYRHDWQNELLAIINECYKKRSEKK